MKLVRVKLRNFRCYKEETCIDFEAITALVGKNDSGKSTILDALAIFFDEAAPDEDDPSRDGDREDVCIACEFTDLPNKLILDADYPTSLKEEYLLNKDGRLEIHKVFDLRAKKAKSKVFAIAEHPQADGRGDLLQLTNSKLKQRVKDLGYSLDGVNPKINAILRNKIRMSSFDDLALGTTRIPLDAENAKAVWDQLKRSLPAFALFKSDRTSTDQDEEAQDPMKAAVKEALKSLEEQLGDIADHVEHQVKRVADKTVDKLREMDPDLASQLTPYFSKPNWASVFKMGITSDNDIPLNKRGSGVRRLVLLNFFRAKAELRAHDKKAVSIIYAVEEPETSQHPNNQRMLINAFMELSQDPDCQVILSTHTPVMARMLPVTALRYVQVEFDKKRIVRAGDDNTLWAIIDDLGVLPIHDVQLIICVEGPNDINYLCAIASALRDTGEDVLDLYALRQQGKIMFSPKVGSNLIHWASNHQNLGIPEFHLYDRDVAPPERPFKQEEVDIINAEHNCCAVLTGKREIENYIHPSAITAARSEVIVAPGPYDNVPEMVACCLHEKSSSQTPWLDLPDNRKKKKISSAKVWLNTDAVSKMTPALLSEIDPDNDVRSWLSRIKEMMP